jgi:hypothetical protein
MSLYNQPDKPLTEEEKLYAALVDLSQRIPCGGQICLGLNLETAIAKVEAFFTERGLPLKDELLGELTLWREHAEQGLKFAMQCDRLMQQVMQLVNVAGSQRR